MSLEARPVAARRMGPDPGKPRVRAGRSSRIPRCGKKIPRAVEVGSGASHSGHPGALQDAEGQGVAAPGNTRRASSARWQ